MRMSVDVAAHATWAIETRKLRRTFGELVAVDALDLSIRSGELFGLLGPNGAGKTTSIAMLTTMLSPSGGHARVNGFDVQKEPDQVRKSIGIVFQDPSLDIDLTAEENLAFHGELYGLSTGLIASRSKELLALVELSDRATEPVKTFSGGMKRRLEIARGLLHHPKILFLDEPTVGLDPQTRRKLWEYIARLNQTEKITMILTTHYLEEADALCERIAIIDAGKAIALDSPANLKNQLKGQTVTATGPNPNAILALSIDGVMTAAEDHDEVRFSVEDSRSFVPKLFDAAAKAGVDIAGVDIHQPSLEDVFVHLTGHSIRDESASESEQSKAALTYRGFMRR